eukprot:TRINITY_DN1811_c1_g1_i1.p2 TRINITY_DN1811_c1_g1~~TRINITY_DN1811_c1_g1_i1.p2  ORF type:complete len:352 (-),score=88.57 TRINITY_DN1811_c1_g1_i1:31-1086(-)
MKVAVFAVTLAATLHASFALKTVAHLPKIVHQLAPANQAVWPEAWFLCQERWKNVYSDWKYMLWNDEDVDNLVKTKYPDQYSWFKSAPMKILRIDAARAFILDAYGGIYADMDFFPYRKLDLPDDGKAMLVESDGLYEVVQNSFMASAQGHPFWKLCFKMMSSYIQEHPTKPAEGMETAHYVLNATGPWMLGRALKAGGASMIEPLDKHRFNPAHDEAERCTVNTCFMRHISTGCWGVNNVKCPGWSRDLSKEKQLVLDARKPKTALVNKEAHLSKAESEDDEDAQSMITDAFVDEFVKKLEAETHAGKDKHRLSLLETGSSNGPARIFQHLVGPHLAIWTRYLEAAESLR